jgi:hypothetical protein
LWFQDMTVDSHSEGSESNPQSGLCTDFYPHKQKPPPIPKIQLSECVEYRTLCSSKPALSCLFCRLSLSWSSYHLG